jgi:hypothetical protein
LNFPKIIVGLFIQRLWAWSDYRAQPGLSASRFDPIGIPKLQPEALDCRRNVFPNPWLKSTLNPQLRLALTTARSPVPTNAPQPT